MQLEDVTRGSYWSTMPADVRYNKDLSMAAKVIYSEIASLCNSAGYCWAKNEYFAQLFGVSICSVSRWISQLEKLGCIRTEMATTEKGSERRIYAGLMLDREDGPDTDSDTQGGLSKIDKGGLSKIDKQNNNIIN